MISGRLKIARAIMPFYMIRKRWTKWEKASILSTNRLQFAVLVAILLPPAPPRRISELKSAPSATLSIPASRSWLIPVDVSTVSTRDSIWSKLKACTAKAVRAFAFLCTSPKAKLHSTGTSLRRNFTCEANFTGYSGFLWGSVICEVADAVKFCFSKVCEIVALPTRNVL